MKRRSQSEVKLIFEFAATSVDDERWVASGWRECRLSTAGRRQAQELGERRQGDEVDAVFCSDLPSAVETARIAFGSRGVRVLHDWRLRDLDVGDLTGGPVAEVEPIRARHLYVQFPAGESYVDVVARVRSFLGDVGPRYPDRQLVIVGHPTTKIALDHVLEGVALPDLVAAPVRPQPGWSYSLAVDT